ncbi:MAG TPA: hypothetical protein VMD53_17415 [Rhizomicrobium sp.]|nr:hypothetical protein [Rhizomicrobium sp.]
MLFRAIFWIGVVAVLMPREPDLGLGRPGASRSFAPDLERDADFNCRDYGKTCATALSFVDTFQSVAVKSLAQVKADIEEDERATAHHRIRTD